MKTVRLKKYSSGLTIIELIITMTISSILMTYGVVKYIDFNKTQSAINNGLNIKTELRQVQGKAISGVKPVAACLGADLNGYIVNFYNDNLTYCPDRSCLVSQAVCGGTALGDTNTYILSEDFIFDPAPSPITFFSVKGGVNTDTALTIRGFTDPNDHYYQLCITTGGDIKDCGNAKNDAKDWVTECGGCP